MRLMIKYLLSLFLMLLFISCNYCYQTHLEKEEVAWCSAYKKDQILIFKSNKGNLDTIIVATRDEGFSNMECNFFSIGRKQHQYINIELKPRKCHNPYYCEAIIGIQKDEDGDESFPFFRIFGLEHNEQDKLPGIKVKLQTTGKNYDNACYFEDGQNATNGGNNYLKSFYWDKQDGLIRYDAHSGEVFEFYKLIK